MMSKLLLPQIGLLAVLSIARIASGNVFIDESKFRQWCLGGHPDGTAACEAYVSATYDKYWTYGMFYDKTLACPPKTLTPQQLRETVVTHLRQLPVETQPGSSATVMVLQALKDKWPCGDGVNTGLMVQFETFHSWCSDGSQSGAAMCTGFVAGAMDASSVLYLARGDTKPARNCFAAGLSWGDVLETVKQFLVEHLSLPSHEAIPTNIVERAIVGKFNCYWGELQRDYDYDDY